MKNFLVLFLIGTLSVFAFQNCGGGFFSDMRAVTNNNFIKLDTSTGIKNIPPSFAFFADAMDGVGSGNHISETSPHANIHFVISNSPQNFIEKLKQIKTINSKSFLMLQGYIFEWKSVKINADADSRLKELKSTLAAEDLLDVVVGIYLIDEPYWVDSLQSQPLGFKQVYDNLKIAAELVQKHFGKEVLLLSSEAYPVLDTHIANGNWPGFPEQFDLLAVNCYLAFGVACDGQSKYKKYIDALESALKINQRQFLTLDNFWNNESQITTTLQNKLIERTKYQVNLAKEKKIPLLVSFLYQSQPSNIDNLVGLDQMPLLFDYVASVSSSFRGVTHSSPQ
ncbi:MAG: hypothetical protein ACLGGX_05140 [Bdellovibrionia bacterium]